MRKRLVSLLAATMLAVLIAGCGQNQDGGNTNNVKPIKVGVIYSASGSMAHVGTEETRAVNMVEEELKAAGGINGHPIEFILENDDTNSEKAVAAAKKLAYNDGVYAIIGPITSSGIAAVKSITESARVPQISITGSSPKLTKDNPQWYFRNAISSEYQTKSLVKYCVEKLGYKKFAVLYDAARTVDQYQGFVNDLAEFNLKPVAEEKFQTGETSFNAQLLKIKEANPDAILVLGAITEGAAAAKQARDLGIKARLLGVVAFAYNDFIKLGGSAVEGTIACTTFFPSNPDPKVQAFVKKYKEKFNEEPDHAGAHTYDALQLLIQAIKNGQLDYKDLAADRQKIRDELLKVNNYQGVAAPITYGPNDHDGYQDLLLVEVKNGAWQVIKE